MVASLRVATAGLGKPRPAVAGRGSGWTRWRRGGQSVAASSVMAVRAEDSSMMVLAVV